MKKLFFSFDNHKELIDLATTRSQRFYVIKLKSVLARLLNLEQQDYFADTKQNILQFLTLIKASDILSNGTDFFWLSVHRLYNAFDAKDKRVIEIMYSFFIQNAYDSFYFLLPIGSSIRFPNFGDGASIFINLELSLKDYFEKELILTKEDNNVLKFGINSENSENGQQDCLIDINSVAASFSILQGATAGNIKVLFQRHQNIFELIYFTECCSNEYLGTLFTQRINQALRVIELTSSEIYESILSGLNYIVPLGDDFKSNPQSFASAQLKRTIFLSLDLLLETDLEIAENIIHEYSHCELHYIQDTILVSAHDDSDRKYYSPWRLDARPLLGLLHAIYVSYRLIVFYEMLADSSRNNEDRKIAFIKIEKLSNQINIAIKQIDFAGLTEFSEALISHVKSFLVPLQAKFSINFSSPPQGILDHMLKWQTINNTLFLIE